MRSPKKFARWFILFGALCFSLFLAAGCSAKKEAGSYASGAEGEYAADQLNAQYEDLSRTYEGAGFNPEGPAGQEAGAPDGSAPEGNDAPASAAAKVRKLVKQAVLSVEADKSFIDGEGKLTGVQQKVDELLAQFNAYSEQTSAGESDAHFTIRVPQASYESFLSAAGDLGKVRSRRESAEDVTLKYYDLEGRLATKKTLLVTFQAYLGRTQNIDDVMKVETRIAELQNEIDWLGTQLTQLASLVDYATIELSVYSPRTGGGYTLGDRVGDLFRSFGDFASGALVVILGILVYGVPIIVLCLFAFWLLFGKVGILKKAFRLASGEAPNKIPRDKKDKEKTE